VAERVTTADGAKKEHRNNALATRLAVIGAMRPP
jgi:hypothetical protein